MQGIPPVPIDGSQYAGPFAGIPSVLEYDAPTGGYKLVVVNETGVALNISGTVQVTSGQITLVGGSQYGEDTVHLSGGTGTFVMGIRHDELSSTVGTDGDYAGLHVNSYGLLKTVISSPIGVTNAADTNPTGVYTISHLKAYRDDTALWNRLMGFSGGGDQVDNDNFAFNLNTNSLVWALNASGDMDRIRGNRERGLYTTMISGSFPGQDVATIIDDAIPGSLRAGLVGAASLMYDVVGGNWERVPARSNANDGMTAGVFPQTIGMNYFFNYGDASWARMRGGNPGSDGEAATNDNDFSDALNTKGALYGVNPSNTWDRLRGAKETGLNVTMISGAFPSYTEAVPADASTPLKTLQTTSYLMGYNGVTYDRLYMGASGSLAVDLITGLDPLNDEVTAYVTGTLSVDPATTAALTDAYANPTVPNVGAFNMIYDIVGGDWDRDPARVYANTMASPIAPQRIAFGMHFDYALGTNHPNYGMRPDTDGIQGDSGGGGFEHGQNVNAIMYGRSSTQGFDRLVGTKERGLNVSLISGSFPGQAASIEINDAIAGALRAGIVGSAGLMYDVAGGNWERDPARVPGDAMSSSTVAPQRVSFNEFYDYSAGTWQRIYGGDLSADAISAGAGGANLDNSLNTRAALLGHRGNDTFDRMIGTKETGLNTSMISGSFPDGSEALPADAATPRKALQTTSYLMGYNGATYDRLYMGVSGSLLVDLVTGLDPVNDEVTAYVTGTLSVAQDSVSFVTADGINPTQHIPQSDSGNSLWSASLNYGFDAVSLTWDRFRIDPITGGLSVSITGTASVDTELPAAVAAADGLANPTAPSVLSHLMGYNGVTYDRIYMGQSGSLAVDMVSQLDPINDEVTAYITGTTSLNLGGKTVVRAVLNISGIALDQVELVAAVGGEKIKVIEAMIIGNADVSFFFQSGFTGTALTGPMSLPSDGDGFFVGTPAQIEAHHFETIAGENLVLDLDANVLLGGWINYYTEA